MAAEISLSKLQDDVYRALKAWHNADADSSPLDYLQLFRQARFAGANNARQATNKVLLRALEALTVEHERAGTLLRKRFLDGKIMHVVANSLNMAESTAYRLQNEALERLAHILYRREAEARKAHRTLLSQRLEPPTYSQLIGVEAHFDELMRLLTSSKPPWLVSIEGLGGIGKTSLADVLSRQIIEAGNCDDFGWVSARPQLFNLGGGLKPVNLPALTTEDLVEKLAGQLLSNVSQSMASPILSPLVALQTRLKQGFHLIVVDNLETITDIETLLPILRDLSNPTKFLLTSRESLHYESGVYHFKLPELAEAHALNLIRYEAQLHNLPDLETADEQSLRKIYEIVGGNPLALRLVVGQTHIHTLDQILLDLETAKGQKVEMLYTFIYRRAWDSLDELTREVFLAMPMVTEKGGELTYLADLTGQDQATVRDALEHLTALNLVDSKGDLSQRRYTIHNLTRTFLQEKVAKWT